jgi:hypothetical protein
MWQRQVTSVQQFNNHHIVWSVSGPTQSNTGIVGSKTAPAKDIALYLLFCWDVVGRGFAVDRLPSKESHKNVKEFIVT